jgi:UDP-N-acetylglucosamine transferase subunit ALG13
MSSWHFVFSQYCNTIVKKVLAHPIIVVNYYTQNLRAMVSEFSIIDSYHIAGSLFQVARTNTVLIFIAWSIHGSAMVNRQ